MSETGIEELDTTLPAAAHPESGWLFQATMWLAGLAALIHQLGGLS